jgi:hypothetical protein
MIRQNVMSATMPEITGPSNRISPRRRAGADAAEQGVGEGGAERATTPVSRDEGRRQ